MLPIESIKSFIPYLSAALGVAAITAFISILHTDIANISMLYLLVVTMAAIFLGRMPAVFASVLAFLAFDWSFVEPIHQFTVRDPAEWLALCMFLLTATVTGQLMALFKRKAEEAQKSKQEIAALAEASWAVASELDCAKALNKVLEQIASVINPQAAALITFDQSNDINVIASYIDKDNFGWSFDQLISKAACEFVISQNKPIGWNDWPNWKKALPANSDIEAIYLPVIVEHQVVGVLFLKLQKYKHSSADDKQFVESLTNHAGLVLQRDRLMKAELQSQALLEADKLKTALLSMISHDFKSPLTSIKAAVSGLLDADNPWEPEEQRSLLVGVDQAADRLNKMVGNILDLSRLEAGAWRPKKEMTQVAEIVGSTLDSFSKEANNRIDINIDTNLPDIYIDSVQMSQVLRNLLENALKYSPSNSKVQLRACKETNSLIIEVLDYGVGLPKGEEKNIFQAFWRASGLNESSIPGSGIGLTLCLGLVEANGGQLTARNRQEGGSIFSVILPINQNNLVTTK